MDSYLHLSPGPDIPAALQHLRERGILLAFLSNFTARMLNVNLRAAHLDSFFEEHLSTDRVRLYKPHPLAYQMGVDAFRMDRSQIAFAAFGAWDAAGAKWFGYPTVWINRANTPPEELGITPNHTSPGISGFLQFIGTD